MTNNNEFEVFYYKKNKPKGKRSYYVLLGTFEKVFTEFVVKDLCNKVHGDNNLFFFLDDIDVITLKEDVYGCEFEVTFRNGKKVLEKYIVEIELIFNGGDINPSHKDELENSEYYTEKGEKKRQEEWKKERELKYQSWFLKIDDLDLSWFLEKLASSKDLELIEKIEISDRFDFVTVEEVKEEFKKRINQCIEKGYIIDGKLTKSIYNNDWLISEQKENDLFI